VTSAEENPDAGVVVLPIFITAKFCRLPANQRWSLFGVVALSDLYSLRRANGDWFAVDAEGAFRVPVFRSSVEALQARAYNIQMLVFNPVLLDERHLADLGRMTSSGSSHFWLVDQPAVNLKRGRRLEHAQLAKFESDANGRS
jgi:hypothetical protein